MADPGQTQAAKSRKAKTPRSRLLADRVAKWVVSAGGLAIIVSILGILFFILAEVWPLTTKPRIARGAEYSLPGAPLGAVLTDEHRSHAAALAADGELRILRLRDKQVVASRRVVPEDPQVPEIPEVNGRRGNLLTRMKVRPEGKLLAAATRDGRVLIVPVSFAVTFDGANRVVTPEIGETVVLQLDAAGRPLGDFSAQIDDDGNATAAAELADGTVAIAERSVEENMLSGETTESVDLHVTRSPYDVTAMVLDEDRKNLYAGTAGGELVWWPLKTGETGEVGEPRSVSAEASPVTALTLLIGARSLVVGQGNGALSVWFPVREADDSFRLTRVRDFPSQAGAIRALAASPRDKGFLAVDASGELGLYYSTSHRVLWRGRAPLAEAAASLSYAPKADGAFLAVGNRLAALDIFNPHPEVNLKALFGKVWYEGYDKPEYVWQSSGGSDDFEPKLSLTPLLVGTLKGTFYSLLLAIPLGVLGAMYTSQFMHPTYKRYLKPMVEIMAALPSVVLGFLAGLWLAPRIEDAVPALALMVAVLPLVVLAGGYALAGLAARLPRPLPAPASRRSSSSSFWPSGSGSASCCRPLSRRLAFGGNFQSWLLRGDGARLRPAQRRRGRPGDGLRGDPDHLHDRRGRLLERAAQPGRGLARARRRPLADGDPGGPADRHARHLLGRHDRLRPRRGRDHDRADGDRQHADHGLEPVQRLPHAVGEHRGRDPRGAARRHALPGALPGRAAAVPHDLPRQHRRRAGAPAPARTVLAAVDVSQQGDGSQMNESLSVAEQPAVDRRCAAAPDPSARKAGDPRAADPRGDYRRRSGRIGQALTWLCGGALAFNLLLVLAILGLLASTAWGSSGSATSWS